MCQLCMIFMYALYPNPQVSPTERRKGLATAMLKAAESKAGERGSSQGRRKGESWRGVNLFQVLLEIQCSPAADLTHTATCPPVL